MALAKGIFEIALVCVSLLMFMSDVILEQKQSSGLNFNFFQQDYNITPERVVVARYDKRYVNQLRIKTFKHNRTTTAFNSTINFNFDVSKLEVIVQMYKFLSNEYRYFPLRLQVTYCKAVNVDISGIKQCHCGNYTGCPMLKGVTYYSCNWTPLPQKLPPYIPTGRYMLEIELQYLSVEVGVIQAYGSVTRPEV